MASFNLKASLRLWKRRRRHARRRLAHWDKRIRALLKDGVENDGRVKRARAKRRKWLGREKRAQHWIDKRKRQIKQRENELWGGCRQVTNEVIDIVNGRASVTSRKRWELFGNPGSDHHRSQKWADAVDFGIADAHWLKNEISRRLGGPDAVDDFQNFNIVRNGHTFRVQMIAATHGTGPHLHVGVRRVS